MLVKSRHPPIGEVIEKAKHYSPKPNALITHTQAITQQTRHVFVLSLSKF